MQNGKYGHSNTLFSAATCTRGFQCLRDSSPCPGCTVTPPTPCGSSAGTGGRPPSAARRWSSLHQTSTPPDTATSNRSVQDCVYSSYKLNSCFCFGKKNYKTIRNLELCFWGLIIKLFVFFCIETLIFGEYQF